MRNLTAEGQGTIEDLARRHGFGTDAVTTMLRALERGGGSQAQFSHPDFGGMGQWSRGGMIMIGDMFNNGLKARVDHLCNDLGDVLRSHDLFVPEQPYDSTGGGFAGGWWPSSLGSPSSSGSQNDMSYAYFPQSRRLALSRGGHVTLYDTGDHRIGGVSQQQSDTQNLTFTSQYGTVRLFDLGLITEPTGDGSDRRDVQGAPNATSGRRQVTSGTGFGDDTWSSESGQASRSAQEDDLFAKIERLHELHRKGVLSEAEFSAKKKDLLDRL